jgi:Transposase/Transposase IS116/IS110/IS902 family
VLAHILRTDRHHHRPTPVSSETALAVKALARQHQEAIWARQHTMNRLRSVLLEYYPNAVQAFPNLTHRAALTILAAVPSPARAAQLTTKKTVTLLRRCGRGDRPGLAEQIRRDLTAAALRQPPAVERALAAVAVGLVSVITAMETVIAELEVAMTTEFDRHRHAELLRSVPGLGPVLAARVLAEIGDDPNRFAPPADSAPSPAPPPSHGRPGEPRQSTLATSATAASAMPATGGPSPPLPNRPGPELTTTADERPRRPQRGPAKPRRQTPQPSLVVPRQQPNLGRNRRLANSHNTTHQGRCLTTHRREVSTSKLDSPARRRAARSARWPGPVSKVAEEFGLCSWTTAMNAVWASERVGVIEGTASCGRRLTVMFAGPRGMGDRVRPD